jgi:signal peptidase II
MWPVRAKPDAARNSMNVKSESPGKDKDSRGPRVKSIDIFYEDTATSLKWLWLSAAILLIDQAAKAAVSKSLDLYDTIPLLPMLNLTLMHNTGAAFSFLNEAGGWQRWLFISLAVVVSAYIIGWLRKVPSDNHWLACALALVLGGAIGNLWDRVVLGYVVDFIDVYYGEWHWPAFNVADSAITIGAIMLLIDTFRQSE